MADEPLETAPKGQTLRHDFTNAAPPDAAALLRNALDNFRGDTGDIYKALAAGGNPANAVTPENYFVLLLQPDLLKEMISRGLDVEDLSDRIKAAAKQEGEPYSNITQETATVASELAFQNGFMTIDDLRLARTLQQSVAILAQAAPSLPVDIKAGLEQLQEDSGNKISGLDFAHFSVLRQTLGSLAGQGLMSEDQMQQLLQPNGFASLPSSRFAIEDVLTSKGHFYDHLKPDGTFNYIVRPGDTPWSIARRFQAVIGGENIRDSLDKILQQNGIQAGGRIVLSPDHVLKVPVREDYEVIEHNVQPGDTLWGLTRTFNARNILDPSLGADLNMSTVERLAAFNNINVNAPLKPGETLYVPIENDFAGVDPIAETPNVGDHKTYLITDEPPSAHHREVFSIAAGATRAIDPQDPLADLYSYTDGNLGEYSPELRNMVEEAIRDGKDVVMNLSIANVGGGNHVRDMLMAESIQGFPGDGEVSFFVAAGNDYDKIGPYTVAAGYGVVDNSVLVGAARQRADGIHLENYSSSSADIVAPPLPLINGEPEAGTSFASPYMAALFRKMNERYGDTLSHTEIMDAAYLSTDLDLLGDDGKKLTFKTNGGGRPYHDRAGAGIIDPDRWAENLDKMVTLKRTLEHDAKPVERNIDLGAIEPKTETISLPGTTATIYSYKIPIPEDMTLDRLTIHTPYENEGALSGNKKWIELESPSGFTADLPPSLTDMHPTTALALEDVHQGDTLTLRTTRPLGDDAYIRIRGYEDGNAVQLLRDTINRWEPGATYNGDNKIDDTAAPSTAPDPDPPQFQNLFRP